MYESGPRSGSSNAPTSMEMQFDTKSNNSGRSSSYKTPSNHRKLKSPIGSLCVGILFCTVILFVLVSLDPSKVSEDPRLLVTFPHRIRSHTLLSKPVSISYDRKEYGLPRKSEERGSSFGYPALEGLGMLFRKGKRAMAELVVAHLSETTTAEDLRFFLRGLHRSGTPARADVVFLFPWRPQSPEFLQVISEEDYYFQRLLLAGKSRAADATQDAKLSVFNSGAYTRTLSDFGKGRQVGLQDSIWGKNDPISASDGEENLGFREERVHFGAIVGFDMQELDPDDALSGFLDSSPAVLRRWLCYEILLGMVSHRYRHVLLTEVTGVFILHDALAPLKKKDTSLHLYYTGQRWSDPVLLESPARQAKNQVKNLRNVTNLGIMESVYGKSFWSALDADDKTRKVISAGAIMGCTRQVRTLTTAMATEIVRGAILRRSRAPFTIDSPLLSFLVSKNSVLGKKLAAHLQVHENGASTVNLLPGPGTSVFDNFFRPIDHRPFAVLQGLSHQGVSAEILKLLRRDICRSRRDVEIYRDCYVTTLPGS